MESSRNLMREFHFFALLIFITCSVIISVQDQVDDDEFEAAASVGKRKSCEFRAIFNFGDSNSDTGAFSAAFGQFSPPLGETYFHAPAGRLSDGRLIIDFIAQSFGLPYLSAFLDAMGSNFTHGANFAFSESTVIPREGLNVPFSLDVQSIQFNDFLRRSQIIRNQGGFFSKIVPKKEDIYGALYTFDIGQNDLYVGLVLNMTNEEEKANIHDVINQIKSAVQKIYDQGGRSFWIHNTGPLGCLPRIINSNLMNPAHVDKIGCASHPNEVAKFFNQHLRQAISGLRMSYPLALFTYVDIYSVKYDLISRAKEYGFEQPFTACFKNEKSCENPSKAVHWDDVHYTEAANKWVFDKIVDGSYSDPPVPLTLACHRFRSMIQRKRVFSTTSEN